MGIALFVLPSFISCSDYILASSSLLASRWPISPDWSINDFYISEFNKNSTRVLPSVFISISYQTNFDVLNSSNYTLPLAY